MRRLTTLVVPRAAAARRVGLRLGAPRALSTTTLTWGEGTEGQLGHFPFERTGLLNDYIELSPRELKHEEGVVFDRISCGTSHTLAVDSAGTLWSWGKSKYGELGHGAEEEAAAPRRVAAVAGVKFVDVAAGEYHSCAVDAQGRLWTWGYGGSWLNGGGQLGHGDHASVAVPTVVKTLDDGGYAIGSVSAGEAHTAILTTDGEVLTCGAGEYGRNGNSSSRDVVVPEPLDFLGDVEVTQVEAGSAFTLALDSEGRIHAWGRNDQGQLGQGGGLAMDVYAMEDLPRLIVLPDGKETPLQASHIAAGHSHAACVSTDGHAYTWGMKLHLEPARWIFEHGQTPARVYAGHNFSILVATDATTHSVGLGRTCCLGHGDKRGLAHPAKIAALDGYAIDRVSCGYKHVAALASPKAPAPAPPAAASSP